jgi:hypothetical protein
MRWTHRFGRRLALPSTFQIKHELRRMKLTGETPETLEIAVRPIEAEKIVRI